MTYATFFASRLAVACLELSHDARFAATGLVCRLERARATCHALSQSLARRVRPGPTVQAISLPGLILIPPQRTRVTLLAFSRVLESAGKTVYTFRQPRCCRVLASTTRGTRRAPRFRLDLPRPARLALRLTREGEAALWTGRALGQTTHTREESWLALVAFVVVVFGLVMTRHAVDAVWSSRRTRDCPRGAFHAATHTLS